MKEEQPILNRIKSQKFDKGSETLTGNIFFDSYLQLNASKIDERRKAVLKKYGKQGC